jgi:hypothetical protein
MHAKQLTQDVASNVDHSNSQLPAILTTDLRIVPVVPIITSIPLYTSVVVLISTHHPSYEQWLVGMGVGAGCHRHCGGGDRPLAPDPPCKQELAVVGGRCWGAISSSWSPCTWCCSQAAPMIHAMSGCS